MGAAGGGRGYDQVLHALKSALDPAGVLAPGRYEPVERPKYRVIDTPVVVAG